MKRLSLHFAFLFLLLTSLASATLATDIVISASTQPNLRPTGLPAIRTGTVSVSNGSASVTLSTAVPTSHVGIGGYIIELAGTNYYVANTTTTTQITLTSNFVGSSGTTTYRIFPFILLRIYALGTFQPSSANYVVQQGAPGSGSWYKQVGVSVISDGSGSTGYIPQLTLDATTNAVNPSTQNTRYFAGFYRIEGGLIAPFLCFEQFRLPSTTTPTTWADICTFNQATTQPNDPTTYYTARQLDDRWRACSAGQSYYFSAAGNRVSCLNYGTGLSLDTATGTLIATAASPLLGAREAVNVKRDHSCVGDGVTNDTACIVAAITAAQSTGKELYFPAGTYLTDTITQSLSNLVIIGDGYKSSILKARNANTPIINVTGANYAVDLVIQDLGFTGQGPTSGSSGHCVVINDVEVSGSGLAQATLRNVYISQCGGKGLYVPRMFNVLLDSVVVDQVGGNGFELHGSNTTTLIRTYVKTLSGANTAAYRIYAGTPTLIGANGIDSCPNGGCDWGVFGRTIADDGVESYVRLNCTNCNIEDFKNRGIYFKYYSSGNFFNTSFYAPTSGTVRALKYDYVDDTIQGIFDGQSSIVTQGASWTNGYPIHSNANPFHSFSITADPYNKFWNGTDAQSMPQWGYQFASGISRYLARSTGLAADLFQVGTSGLPTGYQSFFKSTATTNIGLAIAQITSQTAPPFVIENDSASPIFRVTTTGALQTNVSGGLAFTVQDTSANALFRAARSNAWADSTASSFAQLGGSGESGWISGLNAATLPRLGVTATKTQITDTDTGTAPAPSSALFSLYKTTSANTGLEIKTSSVQAGDIISYHNSSAVKFKVDASGYVTTERLRLSNVAGDPSSPANGDIAYNSTAGKFRCYQAGAWTDCIGSGGGGGGGGGGLTSITAPTGGAQTGPGISFALGTSGTDASIAGSANTITFNFPTASASNRGLLAASDFSMFNSKIAGSIGNTQIGVGSGTSLSGSAALVYASNLVNNTVSFNGTVGFQSTNANAGTGANVEYGAYTGASSLRMVATGSGWSTPPGTLYGATSAILDAGTGTNVLLFSLNDSGGTKSMRWGIGQSEQMRLTETGLGIGTTSPSTKLHVYAASANTSGIRTERMTSATTPTGGAAVVGVDGSGNFVVAAASVVTDPGANGVMVRTAANTTTARTLTGTSNEITIADGTGVSGNPTFSLSSTFDISGKTSTKPMKVGTTAPATCDTGDFFFDSDAAAGSNVYACTDGAADTWTLQGGGGGGSTAWDALTNPASGNTSLSMGARTTTFTWGTATGSSVNMFSLADGAANTGTGYLLSVNTAASSAAQPFRFTAGGTSNGIEMSVLGVVQKKGTGGIDGSAIITSNSVANSVLDADLTALGDVASTGLWAVTSVGVSGAARTLTCTNCGTGTANLIIQNGNGVSGNPTFDTVQNIYTTATPQFARLGLGAAADATHILKLTGGTVTADTHLIDGVQTWNNAGVTFTAFKLNITNSASGGSSLLTDWQVGGASRFTVALSGAVTGGTYNGLTVSTTTGTLTLANSSSLITSGANSVTLVSTGTTVATLPAGTTTLASLTGAETLTNKTLTAPKFADLGFIADANGNELLIFDTVTSAVNEVTFANAATGANPTFTASGGDSNVGLDFQVKGTGVYRLLATASGPTDLRLFEDTDNGSNYASLLAPSSLASNVVATLPSVTGTLLTGTVGAAELAFGASGAITSSADFTYTTATGRLDISKSLNSSVPLVVTNASSGSAAQARVATSSDISGATIAAYSSTFTPSAGIVAGAAVLDLDGAAAILKGQSGGSMRLLLGSVEHLRLTSSGLAFYGSSSGSTVLTAAAAASGTLTLPATTGTLATLAGSESLTNKKLGSLTSNGLVTTSGGDGTLSVTVPGTNVLTALGVTLNNASGGLVTADGTATLTGKTIDASATGNAITLSSKIGFLGAGCNNTTAGAAWDLPTANAATATCRTPSSNTQRGLLDFTSAATNIAFNTFKLPADWVVGTGFDAEILWQTASTAGNVVWEISLACASPGDADDVAVSYQAFSASPANGTANRLISATKSNITTTGSCAAGDLVTVSVRRQGGTGSDTMTTNPARMAVLELTYWRTQ